MSPAKLEVHEHWYISGPLSRMAGKHLVHSHEGGDGPHVHDDRTNETGPAAYTIDKDEWYAATGMRGGGRKKYTAKPSGVQMPLVVTEPCRVDVVIVGDGGRAAARGADGPGLAPVARMVQTFGARVRMVRA